MPTPPLVFELKGAEAMLAKLRELADVTLPARVMLHLRQEAEWIMTNAKANFVPFRLGKLAGSGMVHPVVRTSHGFEVTLSFGDTSAPYALAIHEHLSEHSPYSWRKAEANGNPVEFRIGGPKYLERPIQDAVPGMVDRIATAVFK